MAIRMPNEWRPGERGAGGRCPPLALRWSHQAIVRVTRHAMIPSRLMVNSESELHPSHPAMGPRLGGGGSTPRIVASPRDAATVASHMEGHPSDGPGCLEMNAPAPAMPPIQATVSTRWRAFMSVGVGCDGWCQRRPGSEEARLRRNVVIKRRPTNLASLRGHPMTGWDEWGGLRRFWHRNEFPAGIGMPSRGSGNSWLGHRVWQGDAWLDCPMLVPLDGLNGGHARSRVHAVKGANAGNFHGPSPSMNSVCGEAEGFS
jgi:hypothetical protein